MSFNNWRYANGINGWRLRYVGVTSTTSFKAFSTDRSRREYALGRMVGKKLAIGQNADGRMEVFYIGTDEILLSESYEVCTSAKW